MTGGEPLTEVDFWEVSPWRPRENWRLDAVPLLAALYYGRELINIVTDYTLRDDGKASPSGAGLTRTRDEWMSEMLDGAPQKDAGAFIRLNPLKAKAGHGRGGAMTDHDVAMHRFTLLEADGISPDLQVCLFAKLKLPIAAIISSGGRSIHAWVRIDAAGAGEYRRLTNKIFAHLRLFGIDASNQNPSRLSRLPGAQRKIGASDDGAQRLLYLNPDPKEGMAIWEGRAQ